jgi:integrase
MPKREFGSVRKLPSGRWQARYLAEDGTSRTAPTTFSTRVDASVYLASIATDMRRGVWIDPHNPDVPPLRDYAEVWLSQRTVRGRPLAPRTLDTYRHSLDAWIAPALGDALLTDITPSIVRRWHQGVMSSTGPTATRQAYALLRAILNTAVADELILRNPCQIRGAGQPNSPERPLLSLEDAERLAAQMPANLQHLVHLAYWAHGRLGELLALRVGDVNLERGTLRIERQVIEVDHVGTRVTAPKVGSRRTVHLPEPALETLRDLLAARPADPDAPLFIRPDGTELRAHHVHAAWAKARTAAGLDGVHFHDLRHAGLTLSAQAGATLAEVMRRAGHATPAAAMRYQHAADERDAVVARRMTAHVRLPDVPGR